MKTFYIFIFSAFMLSCSPSESKKEQQTEVADFNKTELGNYTLHHSENFKDEYDGRLKYDSIAIVDSEGKMTDKLIFESSVGDEHSRRSAKLIMLSDQEFEIRQAESRHHEPVTLDDDPSTGVTMSVILHYDDPYKILGYELINEEVRRYQLSENGKIVASDSVIRIATKKDLYNFETFDSLPKEKLRILRNAIFAQYGYQFKSQELLDYFSQKDWYEPKHENVDHLLTDADKQVIDYIHQLEKK